MIEIYTATPDGVEKTTILAPAAPEGRVRPFSSGSQATAWDDYNCTGCAYGDRYSEDDPPDGGREYEWGRCPLRDAITEACFGDGTISQEVATATNLPSPTYSPEGWLCPARVPQETPVQEQERKEAEERAAAHAATLPLFGEDFHG